MLIPVENEPIIEYDGQRWEYVFDTEEKKHYYLHKNCDCLTDDQGYCLLCGKASPTAMR